MLVEDSGKQETDERPVDWCCSGTLLKGANPPSIALGGFFGGQGRGFFRRVTLVRDAVGKSSDEEEEIVRGSGERDLAILRLWDGEKSVGEEEFRPTRPVSRPGASSTSSNGLFGLPESSRKGPASRNSGWEALDHPYPTCLKAYQRSERLWYDPVPRMEQVVCPQHFYTGYYQHPNPQRQNQDNIQDQEKKSQYSNNLTMEKKSQYCEEMENC
jgi:hypothetical protein